MSRLSKAREAAARNELRQRLERVMAEIAVAALPALREIWARELGSDPPTLRSREIVRRALSHRVQARALGDLSPAASRRLKEIEARRVEAKLRDGPEAPPPPPLIRLSPGVMLTRTWNGVQHQVRVTPAGFQHQDKTYKSLSEIARLITGTRWNGPKFFGLREGAP